MKQRQVWVRNYSDLAKKRMHNGECPACGKHKSKWTRRTDWTCCSKECSDRFYKEEQSVQSWETTRKQAFKRDHYTCKMCGEKFSFISKYDGEEYGKSEELIGDHIVPIAIGGKEFDIANVQTLCIVCNKIKTRQDAKTIAKFRRLEKELKHDIDVTKTFFPKQQTLIVD